MKGNAQASVHKGRWTKLVDEPVAGVSVGVLLTTDEAAARIRMSPRYVRRLVAERRIPFYRFGRSVRLRAEDVDALVDAGRVEPIIAEQVRRHVFRVA